MIEATVVEELCGFLDEISLLAADTYRTVKALEAMTDRGAFTPEAFRLEVGKTDADARLEVLSEHVAALRQALRLSPKARPVLSKKPAELDVLSLLDSEE